MSNVTIHQLTSSSTNSLYHEFAIFNQNNGTTEKLTLQDILNTELNNLYTTNKAIPNAINQLHTDISNIQDILGDTTDLDDNDDIISLIVGNSDSIVNINTSLGSINTSIGNINESIETINGSIETINGKIGNTSDSTTNTIHGKINLLNGIIGTGTIDTGKIYSPDDETIITALNNLLYHLDISTSTYTNHGINVIARKFGKVVDITLYGEALSNMPTGNQQGTQTATGVLICTLPEDMRPAKDQMIRGTLTTRKFGTLTIKTDGKVQIGSTYTLSTAGSTIGVVAVDLDNTDTYLYSRIIYISQ